MSQNSWISSNYTYSVATKIVFIDEKWGEISNFMNIPKSKDKQEPKSSVNDDSFFI